MTAELAVPPTADPDHRADRTAPPAAPRTAEVVAATLARCGVSHVFGVMGNGNAHLLDAVCRLGGTTPAMAFVALRHEAGGVAAADAFARVTGRPAVATCTYGAGFTNTVTALAEAVRARTPLLLVTGDAPTTGPRGWDVDQPALAASVGAATVTVGAATAAADTVRALQLAIDERTAVVLALPHDVAAAPASPPAGPPPVLRPARTPAADTAALDRIVAALDAARRPLVLAGRGARGAAAELTALAGRLGARTCTTAAATGLFPDTLADLGVAGGFSSAAAARAIGAADVVLVVGAGLNQFTTAFGTLFAADAVVLRIDREPVDGPQQVLAVAQALDAVRYLAARVAARPAAPVPTGPSGRRAHPDGDRLASDGRLDPRSLFRALDALLPADRVVASDGGHFIGWAPMYLRVPAADRLLLVGTALQSIGLGFPSAVGAAVAAPAAHLVAVTGDGGGLMALADLESLVRVTRRGVLVVVNDAAYGAEVHQYGPATLGLDRTPMLIPEVDFAALAGALGARAAVVRTLDDLEVLREDLAADRDGLLVLDCRVSGAVVAPYMREMTAAAGQHPEDADPQEEPSAS